MAHKLGAHSSERVVPGCVKMGLSVLENVLLNTKARYNADGLGRASFNEILDSKDRFSERGVLF